MLKPLLEKAFNIVSVVTEYDRHAIELARKAIENGYRQIIAIGGDGTLHQVINGLMTQHKTPTHEVPACGTARAYCKCCRNLFRLKSRNGRENALKKQPEYIDYIRVVV